MGEMQEPVNYCYWKHRKIQQNFAIFHPNRNCQTHRNVSLAEEFEVEKKFWPLRLLINISQYRQTCNKKKIVNEMFKEKPVKLTTLF